MSEYYHGYAVETAHCLDADIIAESLYRGPQKNWRIIAFPFRGDGEIVYDTLVEVSPCAWQRIRCFTRGQEHRYPKRAAQAGSELVKLVRLQREGHVDNR